MQIPVVPDVADVARAEPTLTPNDQKHAITYADAEGADWREISWIVLHIDPELEPDRDQALLRRSPRASQIGVAPRCSAEAGPSSDSQGQLTSGRTSAPRFPNAL